MMKALKDSNGRATGWTRHKMKHTGKSK